MQGLKEFEEDEYGEGGEAVGGELDRSFEEDEYGEGGEAVNQAVQGLVDQIQGLKEFEEDEYGEGGEAVGGELDRSFEEDEYSEGGEVVNEAVQGLVDQIQGLKEFEQDEYGEGGEAVNEAVQGLVDQMNGLKEFEEDEYGEGGEAIGGKLDRSFEEDEYGEGNDLIGGTDPGDASVAGFDASEPLAMSNNFVDFGEANPKAAAEEGQADVAPLSMGDFTIGPDGLPIPKPKSAAKSIPSKEDQSDAETKRLQRQNDAKKEDKAKKDSKKDDKKNTQTTNEKQATKTLDDVHKVLESLNTNMNRLIGKVEETSKAQVSAVKANSANLYNR